MRNIILLGPPGAGKGTQSAILQKEMDLQTISTGDLIREEIEKDTVLGRTIKDSVAQGFIVDDDIIMDMVEKKISSNYHQGYIFDGIPRTSFQAQALDNILSRMSKKIDIVLELKVDENKLVQRIIERYICKNCNQLYSEKIKPKIKGICDHCGSNNFIRRSDDNEKSFRKRLSIYSEHIAPLIEYYQKKKILVSIDGLKEIGEINQEIKKLLDFKE